MSHAVTPIWREPEARYGAIQALNGILALLTAPSEQLLVTPEREEAPS